MSAANVAYWRKAYETLVAQTGRDLNDMQASLRDHMRRRTQTVAAIARTPPAPMEAVAWRIRTADRTFGQPGPWAYGGEPIEGATPGYYEIEPLYTHPPQPDALPGDLRERVAQIIEAAIERHNPGNSLRNTVDDADAILSLIQSERGEP